MFESDHQEPRDHDRAAPEHGADRPVASPWARAADEILDRLGVRVEQGLAAADVERRCEQYGPNRLARAPRKSILRILWNQFASVVVGLLAVAGTLALIFGQFAEGIAILAVIIIQGAFGFVSEWRATRSMEALQRMARGKTRIRRDGQEQTVEDSDLVPGDVVLVDAGDAVPADLRIVEANGLTVDEAALTGESVAVAKGTDAVAEDAALAERQNMLHRGTNVTGGSGEAVVVATGMATELGRISKMVGQAEEESTPLERRLARLGRRLVWITLALAGLVAVAGFWHDRELLLVIETAIALGVAAIPEGLPVVANLALARGMVSMAGRQALIRRLPAVETLGATGVIFSDKTGTLTENRMELSRIVTPIADHKLPPPNGEQQAAEAAQGDGQLGFDDAPAARQALKISVLCSNASLADLDADGQIDQEQGDPTEVALLRAGMRAGLGRERLLEEHSERREVAFDPEVKMMATFHRDGDGLLVAVKGSPEKVIEACSSQAPTEGGDEQGFQTADLTDDDRQRWRDRARKLAADGLRVLAVADRRVDSAESEPYEDLRLLGLVGLWDPPREEVREHIVSCRRAGIRVVMVTGDQADTARAVARAVGIVEMRRGDEESDDGAEAIEGRDLADLGALDEQEHRRILEATVFARVSPEQKLNLIELYQQGGETVAMTGDGVNDAPALKKADIGVAMGRRGTDAAREAADMVLRDDAFGSIVAAVAQGRVIFDSIRKAVMFMLCTNVAEIIAVAVASLANAPLPLRPLQILYLNVLTDALPALALAVGKGRGDVMNRPPRPPDESILTRSHWLAIGGWGFGVGATVLAALALALMAAGMEQAQAVTVSFLTLGFAKLWFVFNLRHPASGLFRNEVTANPWVWAADGLCAALLVAAVYAPGLRGLLKTHPPGAAGWGIVLGMSLLPLAAGQAILLMRASRDATANTQQGGRSEEDEEADAGDAQE